MTTRADLTALYEKDFFDAYYLGILLVVRETNLDEATFPRDCPYTQQQILSDEHRLE